VPLADQSRGILLEHLADVLPFGVFVLGEDRRIWYWNTVAEQITGYLAHEVVGRSCVPIMEHCDIDGNNMCERGSCPATAAFERGTQRQTSLFARHKDGHRISVTLRSIPLRDETGKLVAFAGLFQQERACPEDLYWLEDASLRTEPGLELYSGESTRNQLRAALATPSAAFSAFAIEIERLKELRERHGAEMIRAAKRAVIHGIARILATAHYLGHWNDTHMLLLVPGCSDHARSELQNKLASVLAPSAITWWGDRIELRVTTKSTAYCDGDSFEGFLERLGLDPSGTENG
jgi:PAS domain S-box-containing protein